MWDFFLKPQLMMSFPNPPGKSSLTWSVLKAPEGGVVLFSPPQGHATVATFLVPGYYKIQMTAYDGINAGTETLDVYALAKTNPEDNPSSANADAYLNMDEGKGIKATDSRGGDHNGYLVKWGRVGPGKVAAFRERVSLWTESTTRSISRFTGWNQPNFFSYIKEHTISPLVQSGRSSPGNKTGALRTRWTSTREFEYIPRGRKALCRGLEQWR